MSVLKKQLGVVVQTCNPSTWEAKAVGSWVEGQPELQSETLRQRNKQQGNLSWDPSQLWELYSLLLFYLN
jgi:hypothetical protein